MKRTGQENIELRKLVSELSKRKEPLFQRIAFELSRPTRSRRAVNLSRIGKNTEKGEMAVVPGKVLGSGDLGKELKVAGWQFSDGAREKIKSAGGEAISLSELSNLYKKGMKARIIG